MTFRIVNEPNGLKMTSSFTTNSAQNIKKVNYSRINCFNKGTNKMFKLSRKWINKEDIILRNVWKVELQINRFWKLLERIELRIPQSYKILVWIRTFHLRISCPFMNFLQIRFLLIKDIVVILIFTKRSEFWHKFKMTTLSLILY